MSSDMKKHYHVVADMRGRWAVKREGASRASSLHSTQASAVRCAKEVARETGGEVYIHTTSGTIRDRSSYGNDPHPPKG